MYTEVIIKEEIHNFEVTAEDCTVHSHTAVADCTTVTAGNTDTEDPLTDQMQQGQLTLCYSAMHALL